MELHFLVRQGLLIVGVFRLHSDTHSHTHNNGMTPMDEGSARHRDHYLATHCSQQADIHASSAIQSCNPSKPQATNSRLKPRSHWESCNLSKPAATNSRLKPRSHWESCNPSKPAATNSRLKPRSHWESCNPSKPAATKSRLKPRRNWDRPKYFQWERVLSEYSDFPLLLLTFRIHSSMTDTLST
jgi:hypothetical protein